MHSREYFYNNYKEHPEFTLRKLAGEYAQLTTEAQQALRDVLTEKNLSDLLPLQTEVQQKSSLKHLSPPEIRAIINSRLDRGEKLEKIKADLQERGVNIFNLSSEEVKHETKIEERFIQLQKEGKSKTEIDQQLKKEFNLPGKETPKIPEQVQTKGAWLIVIGAVLLMVGLPMGAVMLEQEPAERDFKIPGAMVVVGIIALVIGIRQRMMAQKFIRESGNQSS